MKLVYMGTPDFAATALTSIIEAGHEVLAVYTQPDKAKGRSKKPVPSPVKEVALSNSLPVYQPEKLRAVEEVERLRALAPEVIVVAAYGQILSQEILDLPKYGCVNIHASLLPKYRGAAPIEWAILDGEHATGVTTMQMNAGLDTGDILEKAATEILPTDTAESLTDRLADLGAKLILSTLLKLAEGSLKPIPQPEESNYAAKLTKELGNADFTKTAEELERMMRGLYPWPCLYTKIEGKNAKLLSAEVDPAVSGTPGTIVAVTKKSFTIACGSGGLVIKRLQPEGKKEMDAASFLNGNRLSAGTVTSRE